MTKTTKPDVVLYASDSRGVYIPQYFAQSIKRECVSGVESADFDILAEGPTAESYWDAWEEMIQNARVTDENGVTFTLYQDGDLWLIPDGMKWSDSKSFYVWAESWEGIAGFADQTERNDAATRHADYMRGLVVWEANGDISVDQEPTFCVTPYDSASEQCEGFGVDTDSFADVLDVVEAWDAWHAEG